MTAANQPKEGIGSGEPELRRNVSGVGEGGVGSSRRSFLVLIITPVILVVVALLAQFDVLSPNGSRQQWLSRGGSMDTRNPSRVDFAGLARRHQRRSPVSEKQPPPSPRAPSPAHSNGVSVPERASRREPAAVAKGPPGSSLRLDGYTSFLSSPVKLSSVSELGPAARPGKAPPPPPSSQQRQRKRANPLPDRRGRSLAHKSRLRQVSPSRPLFSYLPALAREILVM